MQKTTFFTLFLLSILPFLGLSQTDTNSILHAFKKGKSEGYFRAYGMTTDNASNYKDFSAVAVGGKLKYETAKWNRFSIGAAMYVSSNTGITDMTERDDATQNLSRYELGLFNNSDPSQREIVLLGEAYLKYTSKKSELTIGRMLLKTPFLNPQDGRMIPTLEQGIWFKNRSLNHYTFQGGVLNAIAPRSTNRFFSIEHSMGTYPVGRNPDGSGSGYFGNTNTDFMAIGSVKGKYKHLEWQAWNYYLDNVFNMGYLLAKGSLDISAKNKWLWGAQYIRQDRVGNGGNENTAWSYFNQSKSNVYGLQTGVKRGGYLFMVSGNHIDDEGRFLFPREWGRETLFTFQKRERTEGQSNATNLLVELGKKHELKSGAAIDWKLGWGRYWWQDVLNAEDNKYAIPEHDQINVDIFYHFSGALKGLKSEFLVSWKPNNGETYGNPNFIVNKVDMAVYQIILNYEF